MTSEEIDKLAEVAYTTFWAKFNHAVQVIKYANLSKEQIAAWQAVVEILQKQA